MDLFSLCGTIVCHICNSSQKMEYIQISSTLVSLSVLFCDKIIRAFIEEEAKLRPRKVIGAVVRKKSGLVPPESGLGQLFSRKFKPT